MSLKELSQKLFRFDRPFSIAMWDFSWLERRWPGAGFEDWDIALKELSDRGYDAVRIDAYPHLTAKDISREWVLNPVWSVESWGAPSVTKICLKDDFRAFLSACRRHKIRVALSSWFRQDQGHSEMDIRSPADFSDVWVKTLNYIDSWGELDNILYIDMCNEWPFDFWAPFVRVPGIRLEDETSVSWMKQAVLGLKKHYPDIPVTFSFSADYGKCLSLDVSCLDFLEPHVWMAAVTDFYSKVGYHYELFDNKGYTNLALRGEKEYLNNEIRYVSALSENINQLAEWAKASGKPLVTTECWSVVNYKDWPLLNWDWVKSINRFGTEAASSTGCWAGIATSNFCAPQFVGMWRDLSWHRKLTRTIREGKII